MKEMKPQFELTRIYSDGSQEAVQIVPLLEAIEAKMNRRGFFGAGITAAAAVMLLSSCDKSEPELLPEPDPIEPEPDPTEPKPDPIEPKPDPVEPQ